jgi:hypothetical protein
MDLGQGNQRGDEKLITSFTTKQKRCVEKKQGQGRLK